MRDATINKCQIQRDLGRQKIGMILGYTNPVSQEMDIVTELKFERVPSGMLMPECAVINFEDEMAQTMIDELWRAGFVPSLARSGDAQVEAIKAHLSDMRFIVADKLKVKLWSSHE